MASPSPADWLNFSPALDQALAALQAAGADLPDWPRFELQTLGDPPSPLALAFVRDRIEEMRVALDVRARRGHASPAAQIAELRRLPHDDPALNSRLLSWLESRARYTLPSQEALQPPPGDLPTSTPYSPQEAPLRPLHAVPPSPKRRERPAGYVNTAITLDDPIMLDWFNQRAEALGSKAFVVLSALNDQFAGLDARRLLAEAQSDHALQIEAISADSDAALAEQKAYFDAQIVQLQALAAPHVEAETRAACMLEFAASSRLLANWLWLAVFNCFGPQLDKQKWLAGEARLLAAVVRARRPDGPLSNEPAAAFGDALLDAVADSLDSPTPPELPTQSP